MSVEAISRGADHATVIELSGKVVRHLQAQAQALDIAAQMRVVRADAVHYLQHDPTTYDLVIIDPPFATPEVVDVIAQTLTQGWLAPEAIVVCERELVRGKSRDVAWPERLTLETTKHYGQAVVEFLRFDPEHESSTSS